MVTSVNKNNRVIIWFCKGKRVCISEVDEFSAGDFFLNNKVVSLTLVFLIKPIDDPRN